MNEVDYNLSSAFLGQCLDLTNGSLNDNTVMQIWKCTDGDTDQVWTTTS